MARRSKVRRYLVAVACISLLSGITTAGLIANAARSAALHKQEKEERSIKYAASILKANLQTWNDYTSSISSLADKLKADLSTLQTSGATVISDSESAVLDGGESLVASTFDPGLYSGLDNGVDSGACSEMADASDQYNEFNREIDNIQGLLNMEKDESAPNIDLVSDTNSLVQAESPLPRYSLKNVPSFNDIESAIQSGEQASNELTSSANQAATQLESLPTKVQGNYSAGTSYCD
jgi:hypothetical protein